MSALKTWRLLALLAVVTAGSAALGAGWGVLGTTLASALAGLLALVALGLVWPLFGYLFGPILFYDLVGSARRGRYVVIRCVYIVALLVMLFVIYSEWVGRATGDPLDVFTSARIDKTKVAAFNEDFFEKFMLVQFLVIVLLTPGVTAGAVAEEKDRKTLEYLLATDLASHEIVLGKLVSRLGYMTLVLLTGLPVLSLLQLLGGVDPEMMLAGFAATAVTMLSLASLSLFNSVYATKPRTAIAFTYVQVGAYLGVSSLALALWSPGQFPFPVDWLCGGNPVVAVKELQASVMRAPALMTWGAAPTPPPPMLIAPGLPMILLRYAGFHLGMALVCLAVAVGGLRLWARWQASGRSRRAFVISLTRKRLPPVGSRPMFWKEAHAEPLFRLGRASVVIASTFVTVVIIFGLFIFLSAFAVGHMMGRLPETMNETITYLGTFLGCLMLLGVAIRAAGTIGGERDRQTSDSLLTTPLENEEIVDAKWWGSLLCVRKAGYFLVGMWLVGVFSGGLSPFALPLLVLAWLAYAAFAAGLGLWFSLTSRTTLRATIVTLVTLLGVSLGHWALTLCCGPLILFSTTPGAARQGPEWYGLFGDLQRYALTPPATLAHLAFNDEQLAARAPDPYSSRYGQRPSDPIQELTFCLVGVLIYGVAGGALLLATRRRFADVTGRLPLPMAPPRAKRARPAVRPRKPA